jgi:hypothetical protein
VSGQFLCHSAWLGTGCHERTHIYKSAWSYVDGDTSDQCEMNAYEMELAEVSYRPGAGILERRVVATTEAGATKQVSKTSGQWLTSAKVVQVSVAIPSGIADFLMGFCRG